MTDYEYHNRNNDGKTRILKAHIDSFKLMCDYKKSTQAMGIYYNVK